MYYFLYNYIYLFCIYILNFNIYYFPLCLAGSDHWLRAIHHGSGFRASLPVD